MNLQFAPSDSDSGTLLALRLRALAHPIRLRILQSMAAQETCQCGEIVRDLPLAQSTISEHLRILREAGLVRSGGNGPRPCYCVDRAEVKKLLEALHEVLSAIGKEGRGRKARRP